MLIVVLAKIGIIVQNVKTVMFFVKEDTGKYSVFLHR